MDYGYIQIFTVLLEEGLIDKKEWRILITPNEECINISDFSLIPKIKNIDIIDTFIIDCNKIFPIFSNAKNKHLIGEIKDGILTITGDHSRLLSEKIPVLYNIAPIEITLKANNNFLKKYGLPIF